MVNTLTVDVEDWIQSVYDHDFPLTDCFVRNTHRVLEHLAERDVRATFFILGLAAEKAPQLLRDIHAAGHEVQSHGHGHRLIHTMTPDEFRQDVSRSKRFLEDLIGQPITGYRAPAFSISDGTFWALDILSECGYEYDSSIFPVKLRRYGVRGAPRFPHRIPTSTGRSLLELPVASYRLLGRTWPVGGGGYFRLVPYKLLHCTVEQFNAEGHGAVVYMHPYECNPDELHSLPVPIPLRLRMHQSWGRRGFKAKMDRLLRDFDFGPLRRALPSLGDAPFHSYVGRHARDEAAAHVYGGCPASGSA